MPSPNPKQVGIQAGQITDAAIKLTILLFTESGYSAPDVYIYIYIYIYIYVCVCVCV